MVKEKYLPYVEPEKAPEPQKTPKELKKEKRENFWFYNKTKIIISIFVILAILFTWQPWVTNIDPDYSIGLMSQYYWGNEQLEELETMLAPYGEDLNGDGVVSINVSFYQLNATDDSALEAGEVQAYLTRYIGELQTGDVIIYITDEVNAEQNGIGQGIFCKADDELTLVEEGEEVELEDVAVNWRTCDAISKDPYFDNFAVDFYFAIRGKEGTIQNKDEEYRVASEMFFRLIHNEPYDEDLLNSLLEEKNTSSVDASAADNTVSKAEDDSAQNTTSSN